MPFTVDFSGYRTDPNPQEYGRFQQHLALLEDERRLEAFADAIAASRRGKIAVDIGSGTGVLAFLALKHGYESAWLVEPSFKMIEYSRYLAVLNNIEYRCHFIQATAEAAIARNLLPEQIDLVVSETISSVIVGFGYWDTIAKLKTRLSPTGTMIPARGTLWGRLVSVAYSTRREEDGGLSFLRNRGLNIDLYRHTFRSGGNVLQKWKVAQEIANGLGPLVSLVKYDLRDQVPVRLISEEVGGDGRRPRKFIGMLLFWKMELSEADKNIVLSVEDLRLISWCPYYVSFSNSITVHPGDSICITMRMLPIDLPFPYAIQFLNWGKPLTEILYW